MEIYSAFGMNTNTIRHGFYSSKSLIIMGKCLMQMEWRQHNNQCTYPTRPTWSLVSNFSDGWAIRPMLPCIEIFWQLGWSIRVSVYLFQFRIFIVEFVHTHQTLQVRKGYFFVEIASSLKKCNKRITRIYCNWF